MSAATQLLHLVTVAAFLDWATPDGSDRWELIERSASLTAAKPSVGLASDRRLSLDIEGALRQAQQFVSRPAWSGRIGR